MRARIRKSTGILLAAILTLLVGCAHLSTNTTGPLDFDSGVGPSTLVGVDIVKADGERPGSTIRVALSHGTVEDVYGEDEFQLRVFLDSPGHDFTIYHSGGLTMAVTPEFETIPMLIESLVVYDRDEIHFFLPFYDADLSALAVLAWNKDGAYRRPTVLRTLDYIGFEIGRAWFQAGAQVKWQKTEVFLAVSTKDEIEKANNKGWPAGPGQTVPDDGTNPPGNPGKLYKGWPLTFPGNTRFWEYSGTSGFIKRAHIDTNGNGRIDPGEPHGYVGRCPYVVGINTQEMSSNSSTWTSRWKDHGQRIVHRFKKVRQPDGGEKWKVESTHQTQQPDGSWRNTPVTAPNTNPIVSDPYQDPGAVPGNSAFGL